MTRSQIIRARDFNRNTADKQRDTWQPGQLRHVMNAINEKAPDARVFVETMDGLLQEYRIVGFSKDWSGWRVTLRTEYAPGKFQDTRFSIHDLGAIIVMDLPITVEVRSHAIRTYGDEQTALILHAQELHGARQGRKWGSWKATPSAYDGTGWVTYEPHTGNPAFKDEWGTRWYGDVTLPKTTAKATA